MKYTGGFFNLLNPYALLGGLAAVVVFTLHGAIFLSMKTPGDLRRQACPRTAGQQAVAAGGHRHAGLPGCHLLRHRYPGDAWESTPGWCR